MVALLLTDNFHQVCYARQESQADTTPETDRCLPTHFFRESFCEHIHKSYTITISHPTTHTTRRHPNVILFAVNLKSFPFTGNLISHCTGTLVKQTVKVRLHKICLQRKRSGGYLSETHLPRSPARFLHDSLLHPFLFAEFSCNV